MVPKDLREYIAALEKAGEVHAIDQEVDWNLELGAVIRRSYDLKAPAPLFQQIKGYPGFRVLGAPVGLSAKPDKLYARVALALGLEPDTPIQELIRVYAKRQERPIPPVLLPTGPCKENVVLGEDVDLFKLPVPLLHEGDGGRYLGTWHAVITKNPDTNWTNWGMYRLMVHDRQTMGGIIARHQHIGFHYYQRYEALGEPMPFAVAIGIDALSGIVAASQVMPGQDEAGVVGGLMGAPMELVKCETVDLEVPARAEVIIEGHVLPFERQEEGPFGEYTGYRAADRLPRPVYKVSAITYRNQPILTYSCPGVPVDDVAVAMTLSKSANLLSYLQSRFPVAAVHTPPEAVTHLTVVATKVPFMNYAKHLANAIWGSPFGRSSYYIVVVEDDVDIFDFGQVLWALATRCHPDRGILKIPDAPGMQLLPFCSQYERNNSIAAYALFDCTWPRDWPPESIPDKASFDNMWPETVQKRVVEQWETGYGFSAEIS